MNLFRWFILRPLRADPARTGVTVAGIAVGIAVVIAIRLANTSSVLGFETALNAMSGRTSLEITGAGNGVAEERLAELGWLREYGLASPVVEGDVLLAPPGAADAGAELVRLLGVDILRDRPFRDYPLVDAAAPGEITTRRFLALLTDPQAVILTRELAGRRRLAVGSAVDLVSGGRRAGLIVKGLLGPRGSGRGAGRQLRPDGHRRGPAGAGPARTRRSGRRPARRRSGTPPPPGRPSPGACRPAWRSSAPSGAARRSRRCWPPFIST